MYIYLLPILWIYLAVGLMLGCFHYFRNGNKDIGAIAELVSIMLIWIVLGLIYTASEVVRGFRKNE